MTSITIIFGLIIIILSIITFSRDLNNACTDYFGYLNIYFSEKCFHIPDARKDVPEIVKSHIGICESHQVQTEDGYVLTLFRLPRENPKDVILFQHPIAMDSKVWVAQFNESVAFLFWKAGYDVWLGNSRGTLYSQKHTKLQITDAKFWDYSFHEMGYYDHNATIEYIKMKTNVSKIIYIGYSMSTTSSLVYASLRPEQANESIKIVINLAPAVYIKNPKSILRHSGRYFCIMQQFGDLVGSYSNHKQESWALELFRLFNLLNPFKKVMVYIVSLCFGWTPEEFDPKYIILASEQYGSEISHKVFCHYYQMYQAGKFQMYDYGPEENLKVYGQEKPALYPIENIKIPIFMIFSTDDYATNHEDVELLYKDLPDEAKVYGKLMISGLNHIDFVYGKHRFESIYNKILDLLDKIGKVEI